MRSWMLGPQTLVCKFGLCNVFFLDFGYTKYFFDNYSWSTYCVYFFVSALNFDEGLVSQSYLPSFFRTPVVEICCWNGRGSRKLDVKLFSAHPHPFLLLNRVYPHYYPHPNQFVPQTDLQNSAEKYARTRIVFEGIPVYFLLLQIQGDRLIISLLLESRLFSVFIHQCTSQLAGQVLIEGQPPLRKGGVLHKGTRLSSWGGGRGYLQIIPITSDLRFLARGRPRTNRTSSGTP